MGRRLRCLNSVDDCTRECVAIEVDTALTGSRVKMVLQRLTETRGLPQSITVDHGPEFEGQVLDSWAYQAGVNLAFIRPGKPNENAYIESFNGKFRGECLNEHWFVTMTQAQQIIEAWRIEYNTERLHTQRELIHTLRSHLCRRQRQPHSVRNFFQEEHVRHAAT